MNDRFNKYSKEDNDNKDPINRDTNRAKSDTDPMMDSEKRRLIDKIKDFFNPDDDPMDTRDSLMMDSDRDRPNGNKVLVGMFDTENEAINVITRLNEIGYWEDEITAIAKEKNQMDYIDEANHVNARGTAEVGDGALAVGSLGGLAIVLPAVGLIAVPGIGLILAAGPISGVLRGVIAGGVTGGLVSGLVQMGVREEEAKDYEQHIQEGRILILVENRETLEKDVNSTFTLNNSVISYQSRTRELAGKF